MAERTARRAGVALSAFAVLYGVMLGIGILLTHVLGRSWTRTEDGIDRSLARHRSPAWNTVTHLVSDLGSTPVVLPVTVVLVVALWLWLRRRREAVFVALAVGGQEAVFFLSQLVIDRHRPSVHRLDAAPPTSSFPSGHTGAAIALYGSAAVLLLWHLRRSAAARVAATVILCVPLAVAFARLYRGMHHPTDVGSAAVNGVSALLISWRAAAVERTRDATARLSRRWRSRTSPGLTAPTRGS